MQPNTSPITQTATIKPKNILINIFKLLDIHDSSFSPTTHVHGQRHT